MADDPVVVPKETIDASNEAMAGYNVTLKDAGNAFTLLTNIVQDSVKNIISYNANIVKAGSANANTTSLNKETAASFAFLTSQVIGTSKAYESLKTVNVTSLTEQTQKMWQTISAGKSTFGDIANVATSFLTSLGLPIGKINQVIDTAKTAKNPMSEITRLVSNQIETFTKAADNVTKMKDNYFQLMGASGGLGTALERSGQNFRNVNELVQEQMNRINGATKATNLSKEQILQYYNALGKVPGALNEQIRTSERAGGTLDGLIAKTRLAAATGRDTNDVINDTTKALNAYNIRGAEALTFVARMSELSNKFGMELSDTQGFLTNTANAFKFIGNEAEGSAKMFNKLMTAFKETGLSAKASTELIQGITNQIGNLSIAQKAFLSSQTGGPGGLVGGFQIEKMLRDGKIDEVFEKIRTQMTRQFGRIVSIDEAANSPQAASQLVRQRAMLQQGPLGQFARNDAEAQRILDAFSKGQKIDVSELSSGTELLNKNLETGKAWQDRNINIIKQSNDILEDIRDQGSKVTNDLLERILTASSGGQLANTIRTNQREGTAQVRTAMRQGRPQDTSAIDMSRDIRQAGRIMRSIPGVASNAVDQANLMVSHTAATERRTGVPSAGSSKHEADYRELVNRNREDEINRLNSARTVGAVNTTTTAASPGGTGRNITGARDRRDLGTVKVEPITVKVVVDASGIARVDHTQQVQAAMNLPNGGK